MDNNGKINEAKHATGKSTNTTRTTIEAMKGKSVGWSTERGIGPSHDCFDRNLHNIHNPAQEDTNMHVVEVAKAASISGESGLEAREEDFLYQQGNGKHYTMHNVAVAQSETSMQDATHELNKYTPL